MAQHVVAVGDGVHDDAEGVEVVQLVDGLVLGLHLAEDGVDVLDTAVDFAVDAHAGKTRGDLGLDAPHELIGLFLVGVQIGHDLVVGLRLQILEGLVLQLPLDLLHTEPVGQGRIDLHGLQRLADLLGRRLVLQRPGVVEPVGDLDENDADVLAHGHEHFPQILHLLLLGGGILHPGQFGDALHQFGHRAAEPLGDVVKGGVGVLDAVVKQRAHHRVGVQADFRDDLGHGQGVDDVGRAVLALLAGVLLLGVLIRRVNFLNVHIRRITPDGYHHSRIVFLYGFHSQSPAFFSFKRRRMRLSSKSTLRPWAVRVMERRWARCSSAINPCSANMSRQSFIRIILAGTPA